MNNLVIEKLGKSVSGRENGTNTSQAQADLLKLLSHGPTGLPGALGSLGNLNTLTAATQVRQNNGCNLMRSYEELLRKHNAAARIPSQTVSLPSMPGPTRRKKKKRRRQPDMPKKACTPFMHFCSYFKKKLMEEGKEFPQFADFGKRAGELWRNMGDQEKQQFNELSEKDRQRYIKDMKEYEERKLAEKEKERELQNQREHELHHLREKEMERLQQQQKEQLEKQKKQHIEQQKQLNNSNNAMNMLNPMGQLNPVMLAALNQSLMQVMMTNPDLYKSMLSEAAKNYYIETMKNIYQNAASQANSNPSPPSTSSPSPTISSHSTSMNFSNSTSTRPLTSNPLANMSMNYNLISLLNASQLVKNEERESPPNNGSSPQRSRISSNSPSSPVRNGLSLALDLSTAGPCPENRSGYTYNGDEEKVDRLNGTV